MKIEELIESKKYNVQLQYGENDFLDKKVTANSPKEAGDKAVRWFKKEHQGDGAKVNSIALVA